MVGEMDWSKAKNILILAFILTNLLLISVISDKNLERDRTLNPEFVDKVTSILEDVNIKVDTDIPRFKPRLNTILVEYENPKKEELNESYFDGEGLEKIKEDGILNIFKDKEELVIKDTSYIYRKEKAGTSESNLNKDQAISLAEKFMRRRNINLDDMKLTSVLDLDGSFKISYSKLYNDRFIENTYTNIEIDGNEVVFLERLWVEVKDLGDREIYIDTAPKALLYLLDKEEFYDDSIKDISLCYYFAPMDKLHSGDDIETREGRAVPAWRIEFTSGKKVVVDEY